MRKPYGLYTKEVMKHFKNPHNMGKIKNPDGIGKVGNPLCGDVMWLYIKVKKRKDGKLIINDVKFQTFGCLPSSEKIVTSDGGWENISEISSGYSVINKNGRETLVTKTFKRYYEGRMLKFVPFVSPFNSFFITPEHPILCIKRSHLKKSRKSGKHKWLRINEKELVSTKPDYLEAIKLEDGDYLVFMFNKKIKDYNFFSKELMRLIGYYVSEGYTASKGNLVAFAFNKNEKKNINEVKSLIRGIAKKDAKVRIRRNVAEVYVCSKKLANLLKYVCGSGAKNKSLSKDILLLPPEKQWELISTWLIGDGDSYKRRGKNSPTYRIATASESLAIQLQEMLARNGIFASISERKRSKHFIEGREVTGSKLFLIKFKLKRKHKFVHSSEKYFLVPIKKIEKTWFKGFVYNFEVASNSHSYLVKGFAVHNCVAAISTSSKITDLAKGKTLEEALKIDRKDIIKSLGGLPVPKIHCSLLATDALAEAIYDYYTKNKLSIPDSLSKRHERIQKILKEVEKRYEHVELEKRV